MTGQTFSPVELVSGGLRLPSAITFLCRHRAAMGLSQLLLKPDRSEAKTSFAAKKLSVPFFVFFVVFFPVNTKMPSASNKTATSAASRLISLGLQSFLFISFSLSSALFKGDLQHFPCSFVANKRALIGCLILRPTEKRFRLEIFYYFFFSLDLKSQWSSFTARLMKSCFTQNGQIFYGIKLPGRRIGELSVSRNGTECFSTHFLRRGAKRNK